MHANSCQVAVLCAVLATLVVPASLSHQPRRRPSGHENLSALLPKRAVDIERLVRR